MAIGRVLWRGLLAAACGIVRLASAAHELLADPEVWHVDNPFGRVNGLAYDSAAEILYEVGYRFTDFDTGARLHSKQYFVRGIDVATGNATMFLQDGSDAVDSLAGIVSVIDAELFVCLC